MHFTSNTYDKVASDSSSELTNVDCVTNISVQPSDIFLHIAQKAEANSACPMLHA